MFKLYPWEWMMREAFGASLPGAPTQFVEPPWKAILSNKGILPLLWAMFPRPPEPAAGLFRRRREGCGARQLLCAQAALFARRRQRRAHRRRQGRGPRRGPLRRRGLHPAGRRAAAAVRRQLSRCSAPGSPPGEPCGLNVREDAARSPRTPRASCRTRSSDRWIAPIGLAARLTGSVQSGAMNRTLAIISFHHVFVRAFGARGRSDDSADRPRFLAAACDRRACWRRRSSPTAWCCRCSGRSRISSARSG